MTLIQCVNKKAYIPAKVIFLGFCIFLMKKGKIAFFEYFLHDIIRSMFGKQEYDNKHEFGYKLMKKENSFQPNFYIEI